MKLNLIAFICFITLFTNCNDESVTYNETINYREEWHLVETNGGVSGITYEFELNTIIWEFDGTNNTLTINNQNEDDTKEDCLDTGTYTYLEEQIGDNLYLTINDTEYGLVTFTSVGDFTLDGTQLSTGTVSDGFTYNFKRILIQVD
ncbi:hypothetical protein LG651_13380 [Tamlana sp. 62-3]|uniref:Lipocalin-like domain-containing protein n=1 Tax=Neotamlana sargassicola TaxID=2883125 RepID=A0A9X1I866_9FLAO|nr:hypothetical protein [Tamlana sargassicola]MCB4809243.1 hypothetical protein [Tamlana sargassicola]